MRRFLFITMPALLALRLVLIFRYRFDSDEPQHMHVAWGWAQGLMQYRDVFDNHMPLFHLLSAPLFWWMGESPAVLFAARLAVVPLFVASVALAYAIARSLFDRRTALWGALLAAVFPPFFLGTIEYRTDDLWVVFWLAAVLFLVLRIPPRARCVLAGLALGLAFAVSMKTVLCALALGAAAIATRLLMKRRGRWKDLVPRLALTGGVAAVIPGMIAAAFAAAGAWKPFVYGVFLHNRIPYEHSWRLLWFVPLYPLIRTIAVRMARAEDDAEAIRRRLFVFLSASIFLALLAVFWPMVAMESYLPFYPLACVLITPLILRRGRELIPAMVVTAMIAAVVVTGEPWKNRARPEVVLLHEVLELTRPADMVMDLKGETLFRRRPYWLVLEAITNAKYRLGMLQDRIAEVLVQTRTCVVASTKLPPRARRFVEGNYLPWGHLWIAGRPFTFAPGSATVVNINVPAEYVVIAGGRVAHASVDGIAVRRGIHLAPGLHSIVLRLPCRGALVWSGAMRSPRFAAEARKLSERLAAGEGHQKAAPAERIAVQSVREIDAQKVLRRPR